MPPSVVKTETSVILQELKDEEDIEKAEAQAKRRLHRVLPRSKEKHRSQDHLERPRDSVSLSVAFSLPTTTTLPTLGEEIQKQLIKTGGDSDEVTVDFHRTDSNAFLTSVQVPRLACNIARHNVEKRRILYYTSAAIVPEGTAVRSACIGIYLARLAS